MKRALSPARGRPALVLKRSRRIEGITKRRGAWALPSPPLSAAAFPGSRQRLLAVAPLAILAVAFGFKATLAQAEEYIHCSRIGGDRHSSWDSYYYTAVFAGDYGSTQGHENDFHDFLKANEPKRYFVHSHCFYEETRRESESRLFQRMEEDARKGYRVMRTGWVPDASGGRSQEGAFTPQPIQDFRISIADSPYEVEVCVRDHQCEDGDRVRVSVNGSVLLSGEIFNSWQCRMISFGQGRHEIELHAVNGTGYKGDCSYADGNTGELRVAGQDSETQSWRHRGGKGSSAKIVVKVQ